MKKLLIAAVLGVCALGAFAQSSKITTTKTTGKNGKLLPSPRMLASAQVGKAKIDIDYGAPSVKGRKIFFDVVPQGKVWRTGANEATTLTTSADLTIGDLKVPAGTYTLYTLPTAGGWWLIVNKQTGQWGTVYDDKQDLGRVKLNSQTTPASQEVLSIYLGRIDGKKAVLHINWDYTDLTVPVKVR